jgi:propionyl-CoA carboxylase alpha chain
MKGSEVEVSVFNQAQFNVKKYMAPPKKMDHAKSVLSPMPGSIVSISIEVGQTIVEGQELLVIEAMKMQNIIKSQVEGKVKKINIKAGVSVAVDQLLIEFE